MSRASKKLSLILRHRPELAGLTLQRGGWAEVSAVLKGLKAMGESISRDELATIVAENNKKRFTLSTDGRMIRAAQGHSIDIGFDIDPSEPPALLWHGTARGNLDQIFSQGLLPGRRTHVHLSTDPQTALAVGARHGKPVILTVDCRAMRESGLQFWQADNGVWLTDHVPPQALGFHTAQEDEPGPAP